MGWETETDAAAFAAAAGERAVEAAERRRDGGNAALIAQARRRGNYEPTQNDDKVCLRACADALEASDAALAAARREGAEAMRQAAAEWCRAYQMATPLRDMRSTYDIYVASPWEGVGSHQGLGYADAIRTLSLPDAPAAVPAEGEQS